MQAAQRAHCRIRLSATFMVIALLGGCAPSRTEQLIQTDTRLRELSSEVEETLARVLAAAGKDQRNSLRLGQKLWLEGRDERCINPYIRGEGARSAREGDCLRRDMEARLTWLRTELHRGATTARIGGDVAICRQFIGPHTLTWTGRSGWSRGTYEDRFRFAMPDGTKRFPVTVVATSPEYRIEKTRIDFFGDGHVRTVYQVVPMRVIEAPWYVVAHDNEEAALDQEFQAALAKKYAYEIIAAVRELAARLNNGSGTLDLPEWINGVQQKPPVRKPPFFQSERVPVPNITETSGQSHTFTASTVFEHEGGAYVLADNGRGALAVFRPRRGDRMEMSCRHIAGASSVQQVISPLDSRFPCPPAAGLALRDISWRDEGPTDARAVLDLPEWGGRRPLTKVQMRDGFVFSKVFAGPLGESRLSPPADPKDRRADFWPPMFSAFGHDQVELKHSDHGYYVLGRDYPQPRDRSLEPPTTYYRIVPDGLLAVCRVEDQVVPPEGYRQERP